MTLERLLKAINKLNEAKRLYGRAVETNQCLATLKNPGAVHVEVKDPDGETVGRYTPDTADSQILEEGAKRAIKRTLKAIEANIQEAMDELEKGKAEKDEWNE